MEAAAVARSGTFSPAQGQRAVEGERPEASRSYPAGMADPLLRLDATSVSVQPGGQAQVGVTVTSASDIVEGYRLSVLGSQPSRWAEVVPPTVNVYPGAEATAVVVFSPPSGTGAASGTFPFAVKATSTESADASSVVEGTVELGRVAGLQAKIIPVTSTGRWRGRHVIRLDNGGNAPARLRLVATDPDANLGFYVSPDVVDLPIGGSTTVRLSARARRPFLRGSPVRHPFQVVGEPLAPAAGPAPATPYGDPNRAVVDAALLQIPILTRAFVTLASLVLVAAVAGGAWAWTRPQGAPGSLAKLGTPPRPEDFQVVGSDATSMRLRWKPVDQIDAYGLQHVDPATHDSVLEDPVNGSLNATLVSGLAPGTKACFKLLAIRSGLRGPTTDEVCARTAAAPASPSPSASPTPPATSPSSPGQGSSSPAAPSSPAATATPGQSTPPPTGGPLGGGKWVLIASASPQFSAVAQDDADQVTAQLQAAGLANAQTVDSRQYPTLKRPGVLATDAWLALAGPYDTQAAAQQDCTKAATVSGTFCLVTQPEPS